MSKIVDSIEDLDFKSRAQSATKSAFKVQAQNALKEYNKQFVVEAKEYQANSSLCNNIYENSPHIYLNPTEALCLGEHIKDGDRVATVLGSGDFAIDAIYHGASEVFTFDINRTQYPVGCLKTSALSVLTFEEFYNFFSDAYAIDFFSEEIYQKIKKEYDGTLPVFSFWDEFFKELNSSRKTFKNNPIYQQMMAIRRLAEEGINLSGMLGVDTLGAKHFNDVSFNIIAPKIGAKQSKVLRLLQAEAGKKIEGSYLQDEKSFEKARESIKKSSISYTKADITRLTFMTNVKKYIQNPNFRGFNLIYLSNIPEYMGWELFASTIESQLMPLLAKDGSIVYCCQGISLNNLSEEDIAQLIFTYEQKLQSSDTIQLINLIKNLNILKGYKILKSKYDLLLVEKEGYGGASTSIGKDTYIKVLK